MKLSGAALDAVILILQKALGVEEKRYVMPYVRMAQSTSVARSQFTIYLVTRRTVAGLISWPFAKCVICRFRRS